MQPGSKTSYRVTADAPGAKAAAQDDPLLYRFRADQLEWRDGDEANIIAFEGYFRAGKDLNKLWIKSEGEDNEEETESVELQLLYSRAIDASWDLQLGLRLQAKYGIMLTQKWVLYPEIEINWFSEDNDDLEIGSGLSQIEAGLRLRYEITRQIAAYIGIHHERLFGDTENRVDAEGEETSDTQALAGIRFWS